jgi:hypothetical protein
MPASDGELAVPDDEIAELHAAADRSPTASDRLRSDTG